MAAFFLASVFSTAAYSDTVAVSIGNTAPNIFDGAQRNVGYEFTPNVNLQVTSLGAYDPVDPTTGLSWSQAIPVGIFSTSGTLLVSATVPANSSNPGQFQYTSLSTPYSLTAGTPYIIDAWIGSENWLALPISSFSIDSAITIASVGEGWYTCCSAVGFEFPFEGPGAYTGDNRLYAGPNFEFASATPLPAGAPGPIAGAGLPGLMFALAGLFGWRRKRKNAATLAAA